MRSIDRLLEEYGESHQNHTNKAIHWICVPVIMFSLIGLLMAIPWPFTETGMLTNWAAVFLALALMYYLRLSIPMFLGFILIAFVLLWGNYQLFLLTGLDRGLLALYSLGIFAIAWIGQFFGHKIEGKKPSFFKDIQFLLVGPAWLMHFIFKQVGIRY